MNTSTPSALDLLVSRLARELSDLLSENAPKTVRGREAQTVRLGKLITAIFERAVPAGAFRDLTDPTEREVFLSILREVFVREYLVSSDGRRVVSETTDFEMMVRTFVRRCEYIAIGRRLGPIAG